MRLLLISSLLCSLFCACGTSTTTSSDLEVPEEISVVPMDTLPNIHDTTTALYDLDTFNIDHYFRLLFPNEDLGKIKQREPEDAHTDSSYWMSVFDYQRAYLSMMTHFTPPEWSGDSKTEYGYEMTYWALPHQERLLVRAHTQYTYVDEQNLDIKFWKHTPYGFQDTILADFQWTLNDFVDKDVQGEFEEHFFNNPPVWVTVPYEKKPIIIGLNINDMTGDMDIYDHFVSLGLEESILMYTPGKGFKKEKRN